MAAILERPRFMRAALLAIVLTTIAACSLVKPVEAPESDQARVQNLVSQGKHAEAAAGYTTLASAAAPTERDNYLLLSAEQWVAAGNVPAARTALTQVSAEARTKLPTSRAIVAAEVAFAENDGAAALRELSSIPAPSQADLAQNYWWLRGKSSFLTNHPVDGTRAFLERERYLSGAAQTASREELFGRLRNAAEHGISLKAPADADATLAGWLQLGAVGVDLERDPMKASAALANWRRLFPQHPANDSLAELAQRQMAVATQFPDQIALLLPLSGRAESVGVAVRDGFVAGYLEQDAASRPRLKVYDVAAGSVASAYAQAVQDGASFIVGPLTKEDVAAVAPLAGRVPMLALNFLSDGLTAPANFYQYALLPEDEARIVARRLVADGRPKGIAILPTGEWGNRVGAAFADELAKLGGTLFDSGRYEANRADFADIIKQTLQIRVVKGEPVTHRPDAQFVFVAGTPAAARLIVPQLKFHYAGDLPVYSTSDAFEPDNSANGDLEGMIFPDMPWMVSSDEVTSAVRDAVRGAWPARTVRRDRLYAFGFDAYRLVPALRGKSVSQTSEIPGVSGKLRLDDHDRIRRELEWAQIKNGAPAPL